MNRKNIQNLIQEFHPDNTKKKEELEDIFWCISSLKDEISLSSQFKVRLEKRLESLSEVQSLWNTIQKRKWQLFFWTFASFLFIGVFLYYISDIFFYNPLSWQNTHITISSWISETPSEVRELPKEGNDSKMLQDIQELQFWEETFWQSTQSQEIVQSESQEIVQQNSNKISIWDVSEEESFNDIPSSQDISLQTEDIENFEPEQEKQQKIFDTSSQETSFDSWEQKNTEVGNQSDMFPVSGMMLSSPFMWEEAWDMLYQMDEGQKENIDFKPYCIDIWGVFLNYGLIPECHKDDTFCTEDVFLKQWYCFFLWENEAIRNEDEIYLEDLINDFENQ